MLGRQAVLAAAIPAMMAAASGPGAVEAGVDAWRAGEPARAVRLWQPLAAAGDADAQYDLAQAYRLGQGVAANEETALDLYRRAAQHGHRQAAANYGLLLFQRGDRTGALPWIVKAADAGDPRAQYVLGTALFNGENVPRDWPRAYALMKRAAGAGLQPAQTSLGQMDRFIPLDQRQAGLAIARTLTSQPVDAAASGGPGAPRGAAAMAERTNPAARLTPTARSGSTGQARPAEPEPAPLRAAVAGKGWRVQLGAFGTQAAAQAKWSRLAAQVAFRPLRPFYQKAGAITRLQVGPLPSKAAAAATCATARATGMPCFPVAP